MNRGSALRAAIARGRQGMLDEMKRSNLRGRGGAGFPTRSNGRAAATRPAPSASSSATPTKASPARSRTACCFRLTPSGCSRAWRSPASSSARRAGFSICAANTGICLEPLRAKLEAMRRDRLLGASICGAQGFDFDIEIHLGRGRLYLRRGIGADRVARRQARQAAHSAAVPGDRRLSRQADGGQQRRDARAWRPKSRSMAARVRRARHEALDGHQDPVGVGRLRAAGRLRISVRRAHRAGARRIAARATSRRCRSAARRASA